MSPPWLDSAGESSFCDAGTLVHGPSEPSRVNTPVHVDDVAQLASGQLHGIVAPALDASEGGVLASL